MKRRLAILMALCLLLSCATLLPVGAEESGAGATSEWAAVFYRPVVAEGEAVPEAVELKPNQRLSIAGSAEILFDAEKSIVLMNNRQIASGTEITMAGEYRIQVFEAATYVDGGVNPTFVNYVIELLPHVIVKNGDRDASLVNGAVYQYYPVLFCDNAFKIEVRKGTAVKPYISGDAWPYPGEFGTFSMVIFGAAGNGGVTEIRTYTFDIYPCTASQAYDEKLGVYVLKISTGSFEGVEIMLDGNELLEKNSLKEVTAVGEHTLDLYVNGEKVSRELFPYYGIPDSETLALRISVELDSNVWEYPHHLNFSRWDADIRLNGEPVSGDIYIDAHGEYSICAVDENGDAIQNCFLIKIGDAEPVVESTFDFTFDNPHYFYVIFIIIPAALLLIAAVCFLILRRTVV